MTNRSFFALSGPLRRPFFRPAQDSPGPRDMQHPRPAKTGASLPFKVRPGLKKALHENLRNDFHGRLRRSGSRGPSEKYRNGIDAPESPGVIVLWLQAGFSGNLHGTPVRHVLVSRTSSIPCAWSRYACPFPGPDFERAAGCPEGPGPVLLSLSRFVQKYGKSFRGAYAWNREPVQEAFDESGGAQMLTGLTA